MLHFTCPWLFWDYRLVLRNPFTFVTQLLKPPSLWQPSVYLCTYEPLLILFVCLFCSLISYGNKIIWYLSFSIWLISLSIHPSMLSGHPCCHKWWDFVLFYGWVIFHCIYVPQLLYPFIYWWTLRLNAHLCYCKQHCNEHTMHILLNSCFGFLWTYTQKWNLWVIRQFHF